MQILRFESDDNKIYTGCDFDNGKASVIEGDIYSDFFITEKQKPVKTFLPPISPAVIFCIGLNYKLHAKETGMALPKYPVVFMKNISSAAGHLEDVRIPASCVKVPEVDYEAELAVVIKKKTRNVSPEKALDHVLGYTCANDISARRWQKHGGGGQWIKGKSFDTFCPLGPWLVIADELDAPDHLDIECVLNGNTMQKSNTSDMIFSVGQIISYLSESTTLVPGTLILTGTPSGVGFTRKPPVYLAPGDVLETKIEKIGVLKNQISLDRE
ncbi:fumarylacetoacetate hydrolase family protein [Desulfobacula phenolica]|uniref:2-keto-4-pentenoate hydratase/2-oxohepta-3-ene-1,7-dioic acid hydratase (Catechol pathway) n=1 Tax=Desulfobacula phenolica TaxID=90732 RepID=A0A1H2FKR1_9BACT|nr:fumarylacetoacetate hydrolase family protein [Desulfobacula phenolica]SDU07905.1 2-keto-4-pentenoate hydratase/2-oxohepta-3-ene-1,7-dioic acid hydratase (catechol pathway) [Desulfobacula phenolica]